jgi:hypothetical protein
MTRGVLDYGRVVVLLRRAAVTPSTVVFSLRAVQTR